MIRRILSPALLAALVCAFWVGAGHAHGGGGGGGAQVVTLWWLFFNNPDACVAAHGATGAKCGPVDVFGQPYLNSVASGNPNPALIAPNFAAEVGVVYATGGLTDVNGRVRLVASIYRTAPGSLDLAGPNIVDPLGLNVAFENLDAEVHVVVRDHGSPIGGGQLPIQMTNFLEPNCSDPTLGWVGSPNVCADVIFAQFAAGEAGTTQMFGFHDATHALHGSRAQLFRNGDSVQVIVDTSLGALP